MLSAEWDEYFILFFLAGARLETKYEFYFLQVLMLGIEYVKFSGLRIRVLEAVCGFMFCRY